MDEITLYWSLIAAAIVLIGAEFFIPGGILGVVGAIALMGAVITGFSAFGVQTGLISAFGIVIGGMILLFLWIRYCPHSFMGKWFTLEESGADFKSFDPKQKDLLGKTGTASTDLRPAGIALIDDKKIDVVAESGFIEEGSTVKIIEVAGSRIAVRKVETPE